MDSGDARAMVGKPVEEIKLIKMMRQKFQTTSIPRLEFEDYQGNVTYFDDYYDYMKPLGCGSFGFVVAAIDKKSGDHVALKVSNKFFKFLPLSDTFDTYFINWEILILNLIDCWCV